MHVENIHISYVRHFLKDDGTFNDFDNIAQYYVQVDDIHNMYARQLLKNGGDDKKVDYIEPFCVINVDESETNALKNSLNDASNYVPVEKDQLSAGVDSIAAEMKNERECKNVKMKSTGAARNDESTTVDAEGEVDEDDDDDDDDDDGDDDGDDDDDEYDGESLSSEEHKKPLVNQTHSKKRSKGGRGSDSVGGGSAGGGNKKQKYLKSGLDFGSADERSVLLLKYVQLKCDLCIDREFESFSDVQRHFWAEHEQNGYVRCCNRKFRRLARILQHCRWHENPEAFK